MGSQATIALPSSTSNAKGWAKKGKGKKTAVTTSETPSDTGAASMDELLRLLNIIEKRGSVLEGLVSRNNSLTLSSKEGWLSFHDGTTWSPAWCYIRNAKFHVHLGNDQDSTNPSPLLPTKNYSLSPSPPTITKPAQHHGQRVLKKVLETDSSKSTPSPSSTIPSVCLASLTPIPLLWMGCRVGLWTLDVRWRYGLGADDDVGGV
ncbi:hypothetical protein BC829DRAFT_138145 [Chytridium lagenaria]|nr:hypothetical protein BC829DRAFT_138145 [Chytridium lagenaria]